jgi:hypothetical protein
MIFLSINKEENFEARAEKICGGASEKERNPKKPNFSSSLSQPPPPSLCQKLTRSSLSQSSLLSSIFPAKYQPHR